MVLDIFSETVWTYTGRGDGTFELSSPIRTAARRWDLTTGDFNSDGLTDVALPEFSRIRFLPGNGRGGFGRDVFIDGNELLGVFIETADFNGDGHLDLATRSNEGFIRLWFGDGAFGLTPQDFLVEDSFLRQITAADFSNDGYPDLVLSLAEPGALLGWVNDGTGAFPDVVDLNGDGLLDLASHGYRADSAHFFLNSCPLQLSAAASLETGVAGEPIEYVFSVTNAERTETVTALQWTPLLPPAVAPLLPLATQGTCEPGLVPRCMLGDLAPGDSVIVTLPATIAPGFNGVVSVTGVFEADGVAGVSATTRHIAAPRVVPFVDLQIDPPVVAPLSQVTLGAVFRNDGVREAPNARLELTSPPGLDLAFAGLGSKCSGQNPITCELGEVAAGDYRFVDFSANVLPAANGALQIEARVINDASEAAAAQAAVEVVSPMSEAWPAFSHHPARAMELTRSFQSSQLQPLTAPTSSMSRDLNADGYTDLLLVTGGSIHTLLGNGSGTFGILKSGASTSHTDRLAQLVELNGDGILDIVSVSGSPNRIQVYLGDGTGRFTYLEQQPPIEVRDPRWLVSGDFDRDGYLDLALTSVTQQGEGRIELLFGDAHGGFAASGNPIVTSPGPGIVLAGDFDHDGQLDLVSFSEQPRGWTVWLGDGNGQFSLAGPPVLSNASARGAWAIDFDQDGHLDVVSIRSGPGWSLEWLAGDGAGSLSEPTTLVTGFDSLRFLNADLNQDGLPDFVVADEDGLHLLINNGAGGLDVQTREVPFRFELLAAADLNQDGLVDLLGELGSSGESELWPLLNTGILEITHTVNPDDPTPGTLLSYEAAARNVSATTTLSNVTLRSLLPEGVQVGTLSPDPPLTCGANGEIECAIATFAPGESVSWRYQTRLDAGTRGRIISTVSASADGLTIPANASVAAGIVSAARLGVKQSMHPVPVPPSGQAVLRVTVTNAGDDDSSETMVRTVFRSEGREVVDFEVIEMRPSVGTCSVEPLGIECLFGSIPYGESASVEFVVETITGVQGLLYTRSTIHTGNGDRLFMFDDYHQWPVGDAIRTPRSRSNRVVPGR